ncbi:putative serine-threonine protein kinase [Phyllosticta citrichinensis]|uniref:EKC/KEOPS complex subunit BUD32 n=1 Tax=Phyllosticta citrichinensis TaxID=1130410 RepID=A0ABR1XGI5_9PEZI
MDKLDSIILGAGGSGFVTIFDEATVIKGYITYFEGKLRIAKEGYDTDEDAKRRNAREREVYERLSADPDLKILKYYGAIELEPGHFGIRLEWAKNRDLRSFIRNNKEECHPIQQRLDWVVDLSETLGKIHSMGVFHCDFSCRNVMVTEHLCVKIADFDGSKLDDKSPFNSEEYWYGIPTRGRVWDDIPLIKRELFALGCGIYEIMAWKKPFGEKTDDEAREAYERGELPAISDVPCADVIRKCWNEEFESAEDVAVALRAYRQEQQDKFRGTVFL